MFNNKTSRLVLVTLIFSLLISSCGSSSKTVGDYTPISSLSGLVLNSDQKPTLVYTRPNAPTLAAYKTFIIDEVQLDSRDASIKKLKKEDLDRIKGYFSESLTKELESKGFGITTTPSEDTMRMSFVLSGIKVPNATANVTSILIPVAMSVGGVLVEGTFRESNSNRIDAVVISRSQGSRVANSSPWSTWADVQSGLDQWAKGIAAAVDGAHKN